jgi:DNA-directed RNA polymerase specialized sigma24 family protein
MIIQGAATRLGVTHDEALDHIHSAIGNIAEAMSRGPAFGYHTAEDIYQESYIIALDCLAKPDQYDPARPLQNFLGRHVKNRLMNKRRDEVFRYEAPCKCCDQFNPGPNPCDAWKSWQRSNARKLALSSGAKQYLDYVGEVRTYSPEAPPVDLDAQLDFDDLDRYILDRLPAELREDYQAFKSEQPLPKHRRKRMRVNLKYILSASPYAPEPEPLVIDPKPARTRQSSPKEQTPAPVVESKPEETPAPAPVKPKPKRKRKPKPKVVSAPLEPVAEVVDVVPEVVEPVADPIKPKPRPRKRPRRWWVRLWCWMTMLFARPQPKTRKSTPRTITHNGQTHTLREWAALLGIHYSTLTSRLRAGWTIEEALGDKQRPRKCGIQSPNARLITYKGRVDTLRGWARRAGLNDQTLCGRLSDGWTIEEAIETPLREHSLRKRPKS